MPRVTEYSEDHIVRAAQTAHEVNRIYALSLGDISHDKWQSSPLSVRESAIAGVRYLIRHPDSTPSQQHKIWAKHRREEGWTFGPVLDRKSKTHPCLVPYQELPTAEKLKDSLFQTVVRGVLGL